MSFLHDAYFWYTLSFAGFIFLIYKFGGPAIIASLDARIAKIKADLETAEGLRVEAQEMLAQYQRKQMNAEKEADKILKDAKEAAKKIQENAEQELKEVMARREQQLEDRLKRMEQNAIQEIQCYAANLALNAAKEIIADRLDKALNEQLADKSIKTISGNLH